MNIGSLWPSSIDHGTFLSQIIATLLLTATWTPVFPSLLCVALLQHMEKIILQYAQQGVLLVSRMVKELSVVTLPTL